MRQRKKKVIIVSRVIASPTQPGEGDEENFRWGQIFIIFFKV